MECQATVEDNGTHIIFDTNTPTGHIFSPWRGLGATIPGRKEIYALTCTGYKGEIRLAYRDVMSKRQETTCKRFLKTGIITAQGGWPANLARMAFIAAGQAYLTAPSRSYDKYFLFENCAQDSVFVTKLASQLATIIKLTLRTNVPIRVSRGHYEDSTLVGFDWDAAQKSGSGDHYRDYHAAAAQRSAFNSQVDVSRINKFMKEAIADTRKELGFVTPEIPRKLTIRMG